MRDPNPRGSKSALTHACCHMITPDHGRARARCTTVQTGKVCTEYIYGIQESDRRGAMPGSRIRKLARRGKKMMYYNVVVQHVVANTLYCCNIWPFQTAVMLQCIPADPGLVKVSATARYFNSNFDQRICSSVETPVVCLTYFYQLWCIWGESGSLSVRPVSCTFA